MKLIFFRKYQKIVSHLYLPHSQGVHTGVNQVLSLGSCHHIAANDLEIGMVLLYPPDHGDLEDRVSLAAVQHHHVNHDLQILSNRLNAKARQLNLKPNS